MCKQIELKNFRVQEVRKTNLGRKRLANVPFSVIEKAQRIQTKADYKKIKALSFCVLYIISLLWQPYYYNDIQDRLYSLLVTRLNK